MKKDRKVVFVGLSGGVDSAVSAALLKKGGYEVVGVFMRAWHPDFLPCTEEEERRDAMRVAARLDIPFLTFDFEKEYKKSVAEYMIREYRAGRTPNPDVMCNKEVKFGVFLRKALSMGADYVATGHYARKMETKKETEGASELLSGSPASLLLKGIDPAKDQSYFLWTLGQKQLAKIIFPIGHLKKAQVRALAEKFGLSVAEKKDSQGICFLGEVDLKNFLKHYLRPQKGEVLNKKGETIGWHEGAKFYTLGERHGFTITKKTATDGRYYVLGKDMRRNTITVSSDREFSERELLLRNTNWILRPKNEEYSAQVRYHGEFLSCTVKGNRIIFKKPVLAASGQSCVLYDRDICMGGGVIV